jgi:glycerol-3-phosphate acyltransferase PlsY
MRDVFLFLLLEIVAYFCGSIPFGVIISKLLKGDDIRNLGSGNIGATNAARVFGNKIGALVLFLDGMKAFIPLLVIRVFVKNKFVLGLLAITVVLGHIYPVWLKFKGGKGVACIVFSLAVLQPGLALIFCLTWGIVFFLARISSLSALFAMFVTTLMSPQYSWLYLPIMLILDALVVYKHTDTIKRLLSGEEAKFAHETKKS